MADCLFCKMATGEISPDIVLETEELLAFRDINPQAPVHVLIVPRKHIASLNDLMPEDAGMVDKMVLAAREVAKREGISVPGYRLVMNCNKNGGQTVYHLHLHLLGGRAMRWPPG